MPTRPTVTVSSTCKTCGKDFDYQRTASCPVVAPRRSYCSPRCYPVRRRLDPATMTPAQKRASAAGRAAAGKPKSAAVATRKGSGGSPGKSKCPNDDRIFTDDEREFMRAMAAYRKKSPFPAWSEVLQVLRGLGYRKSHDTGQLGE